MAGLALAPIFDDLLVWKLVFVNGEDGCTTGSDVVQVEAVENHMPEIVIVDEIGTEAEALACRTIAERGVQLIATAHGQLLENLLKNPTLSDLVGGIQSVTLGRPLAYVLSVQPCWKSESPCYARRV